MTQKNGGTVTKRWQVNFHEEFLLEFREFSDPVRRQAYILIEILEVFCPQLGRPNVDTLKGSKYPNLKELRFRADDGAWRIAFAFDAKRQAILLVGGNKSGVSQSDFYRHLIEVAERRFDRYQRALEKEKKRK